MSFTGETRERTRPAIPLAAMLDVLFLLLIFFMTVSAFRQQEWQIDVQLPAVEQGESGGGIANTIPITFDEAGVIYLGQREVSMSNLRSRLEDRYNAEPDTAIVIRGHKDGRHGLGIELLEMAQNVGFTDVSYGAAQAAGESP